MWRTKDDLYFISNWHVFSGRDPRTGQPKDQKNFAVPNRLSLYCRRIDDLSRTIEVHFPLEEDNVILWKQHPIYGQKVDVAAISFRHAGVYLNAPPQGPLARNTAINEFQYNDELFVGIGEDVFILGFPLGLSQSFQLPIWKRASIASDRAIDFDGLPCFLVDTATREGMSGSPVICRKYGGAMTYSAIISAGSPVSNLFMGIYSGRYVGAMGEAQLGIVWRPAAISDIVEGTTLGNYEIY